MNKSNAKHGTKSVFDSSRTLSVVQQESRLIVTVNPDKDANVDADLDHSLVIRGNPDKLTFDVSTDLSSNLRLLDGTVYGQAVYSILGVIPLMSSCFLIAVTDRTTVGSLLTKHQVYRVSKVALIPITQRSTNPQQANEEQMYIEAMKDLLESGSFYYSLTYDLSHTLERQDNLKAKKPLPLSSGESLWQHLDERFVWNTHLVQKFMPFIAQFGNWVPPIIQGFVFINNDCFIEGNSKKKFGFALVSRRNKNRAGTRYHTRGADGEGNVAAYVETEQILQFFDTNTLTSYVQIRGSIPVLWKQDINLQYEPPIDIDMPKSSSVVKLHFDEQVGLYKKQVLVNLVKEKGAEGPLGQAYDQAVKTYNSDRVRYVGFDVYKYCKTTNYEKLSLLVEQIQDDFHEMGYFKMEGNQVTASQRGVFRTNCKDCLDRTNLVQGLFARLNLITQLKAMGLINSEEELNSTKFMSVFRHTWADNGDAISVIYAGTPALKGDVTRTGKRSFQGMIDDGFNAVARYYINNFQDGIRQDSMDLLLGNCAVPIQKPSRVEQTSYFVVILLALMSIFGIGAARARVQMIVIAFVMVFVIITSKILRVKGRHVVNIPQLHRIKQKMV